MDSGLAIALQQEEKGPSVDLLPQVGASTRLMSVRCSGLSLFVGLSFTPSYTKHRRW